MKAKCEKGGYCKFNPPCVECRDEYSTALAARLERSMNLAKKVHGDYGEPWVPIYLCKQAIQHIHKQAIEIEELRLPMRIVGGGDHVKVQVSDA